jgi:uncharacterized protein
MKQIDIKKFSARAAKRKPVLAKFLKKLGSSRIRGISAIALQAEKEAWEETACLDCGNCCKKMTPTFSKKDIHRIAKHFNMTYQQFFDKWLEKRRDGDITNVKQPCQFLGKDNKCSIYPIRPVDCAGFPHLNRKDIKYQAAEKVYTSNLSYCPATLSFVEKLEAAIGKNL